MQALEKIAKFADVALEMEAEITLQDVCWQDYVEFVNADERPNPRFYYEKGTLLIMPTGYEHEFYNRLIASLIEILAEEFRINWESLGSATFLRDDIERGFEPDSCFYFAGASNILDLKKLNWETTDAKIFPAPDLMIEVDATSSSSVRESIFAAFGVPEIWRFEVDAQNLEFLKLENGRYILTETSLSLPLAAREKLNEFIETNKTLNRLEWVESVRNWARSVLPEQPK